MSSSRTITFVTVAALTALTAVVGYAAYFDYKRRNDVSFRKRLRKQQKKAHRSALQSQASKESDVPSTEELGEILENLKKETLPATSEAKEQYFMSNVGLGEQLSAQGNEFRLPAALAFYRAMRVYPTPMELMLIYQSTVPKPIFNIVTAMASIDVSLILSEGGPAAGRTGVVSGGDSSSSPRSSARTGPPSETSSQEWENLTDSGTRP